MYESGVRQTNVGSEGLARAGISYDLERLKADYQNRVCALVLAYVLGRRRAERSAPLSAAEKQRSTSSSIFVSERSSERARELKKPGGKKAHTGRYESRYLVCPCAGTKFGHIWWRVECVICSVST